MLERHWYFTRWHEWPHPGGQAFTGLQDDLEHEFESGVDVVAVDRALVSLDFQAA